MRDLRYVIAGAEADEDFSREAFPPLSFFSVYGAGK
jgi:hypothetical protein